MIKSPRQFLAHPLSLSLMLHLGVLVLFSPLLTIDVPPRPNFADLKLKFLDATLQAPKRIQPPMQPSPYQVPREATNSQTARTRDKTAQELLNDPKQGKIFSPYFQKIKRQIQDQAALHRQFILREQGTIIIDFVLDGAGRIIALTANPDRRSRGNPMLISRALQIIKDAAPFDAFPPEIDVTSVSFNITLLFGNPS